MSRKHAGKKKRQTVDEEIHTIVEDIEQNTKKSWCFNFKIQNPFQLNDVHNSFLELIQYKDTKMIFVDGPAGTGKSYLAVLGALKLLLSRQTEQIIYIRSIVESASRSMGSLPGELHEKFHPWSLPLLEKLDEIVGPKVSAELLKDEYVKCLPVNFVRGLTFRNSIVIVDESQNLTTGELTTILTRFGDNTRYIIIGDSRQSDINGKSGYKPIVGVFNNAECESNGIHVFHFGENEIVRSAILKLIVKQLDNLPQKKNVAEQAVL
jgi:phosphate starvation-inducible PhoH-like protein